MVRRKSAPSCRERVLAYVKATCKQDEEGSNYTVTRADGKEIGYGASPAAAWRDANDYFQVELASAARRAVNLRI